MSTRTRDLLRFGLLGAAIFLLLAWVQTHWLDICAWLLGRDSIAYDEQPDWLRRANARLVGLSRVQLEELLGRPPATEYFPEYDYVYWLGPERGPFSIDSEWLAITFREDRVASARVVTD